MKKIVIIGANNFQMPLIKKAKQLGYETHVFAWADGAVGAEFADYFYPISIIEKEIVANLYNEEIYCYIDKEGNFIDEIDENNKDNEVITVHIDYNKTDSQEIKFKNEENKKRLLYLLEYIKEEGIYKKIDNIDMTKPNSINMSTKEDINILLNSDEELKYNISRLAMILADLQNKKQKGGEIDLSTGKYALYRP